LSPEGTNNASPDISANLVCELGTFRSGSGCAVQAGEQHEQAHGYLRKVPEICRRVRAHGQVHAQPGKQNRMDPDGGAMAALRQIVRSRECDCALQRFGAAASDAGSQRGPLTSSNPLRIRRSDLLLRGRWEIACGLHASINQPDGLRISTNA